MLDRLGASMKKHQEKLLSGREIQRRVTEFQPKRTLSNSNPNGWGTSQKTLIQPKMGV